MRKYTGRILRGLAALAFLAAAAAAQEDESAEPGELDEIVVTATRIERTLMDAPGSVTVIGLDEIAETGGADIGDVIREAEGVDVLTYGGAGSTTTAHLRGTAGVHALVLVDGRTENSPSLGSADLSVLSPAFVERVEIVRGPASALYGAGAVGGVIQVITRDVPEEPVNEAHVFFGSFETVGGSFLTGAPFGTGGGLLGLHAVRVDGHRPNSDFEKQELFGRLALGDEIAGRTDVTLGLSASSTGWPGARPALDPLDRSASQLALGTDEVSSLVDSGESTAGYLQVSCRKDGLRLRISADHERDSTHREWIDWISSNRIAQNQLMQTTSPQVEASASWELPRGMQAIAGVAMGHDRFQVDTLDKDLVAGTETRAGRVDVRATAALWGQLEAESESWQGLAGARWDEPSDFDGKVTARALGTWKASPSVRLKAGVGSAFRAPSLDDLNYPWDGFSEGNPDLEPEESFEAELGAEWRAGGDGATRFKATVFRNEISDLIRWQPEWDPLASTEVWHPDNLDDVLIEGLELSGSVDLGAGFRADIAYTFLDAEATGTRRVYADYAAADVFTFAKITQDLSYTPQHQVSFSLDWTWPAPSGTLKVGGTLGWVSEVFQYYETWTDVGAVPFTEYEITYPAKKLGAHALLGLRVAWSWTKGEVFVKADNLLDEEYARQFGYSLDDRDFPMPGRSVTAGVRVRF